MNRSEMAVNYFENGYNCSQALVLTFKDYIDLDEVELLKLSSSFGGGISRLREVCGVVSGMSIVLGLLYGFIDTNDFESKANQYTRVQELALKFEGEFKSMVCRDLLNKTSKHDEPIPEIRSKEYYKNRPCGKYIAYGAKILEEYLKQHPIKG